MKIYDEPIVVSQNNGGISRIIWRCKSYPVKRLEDHWRVDGKWWECPNWKRHYYRVTVRIPNSGEASFEIYHHFGLWKLARVLD